MRILNVHLVSSNPADQGLGLAAPFQSKAVCIASGTLSGSFSTPGVNIQHMYGFSVTTVISGSLTGSVQVNGSNDPGYDRVSPIFLTQTSGSNAVSQAQGINNWALVPGSQQTLAAATLSGSVSSMINAYQQFYKWIQVQWTHTAGTGSIDVYLTAKGNAQ